jgi:two-component system, chemotaxis family, chemotaxis protein CheY
MPPSLKLLVVEDDVSLLTLIDELLTSFGAEVKTLCDSRQALEVINREKYHGIFTDLKMPHVDGFEFARQIRKSSWNRTTPIVIISGREDKKTMEEAFAVGGTFFLNKPVDRQKLAALYKTVRGSLVESQRRITRISLRTEVVCQLESQTIRGTSVNISMDGILFDAGRMLQPGQSTRLSFRLPGQNATINATGTIVRVDDKQRVGVRFTSIDHKDRQRIRELLADDRA